MISSEGLGRTVIGGSSWLVDRNGRAALKINKTNNAILADIISLWLKAIGSVDR
jgi:hypothetical protein